MYIKIFLPLLLTLSLQMISCSSSYEKSTGPDASLENTRWVLRALNDKKIFTPESGSEVYITFIKQNSQAKGNAGCNTFFSSYIVSDNQISFGPVARTRKFCEHQMETENDFVKALESANKFKIKGNKLSIYDSTKLIALFEAVYMN